MFNLTKLVFSKIFIIFLISFSLLKSCKIQYFCFSFKDFTRVISAERKAFDSEINAINACKASYAFIKFKSWIIILEPTICFLSIGYNSK